MVNWNRWPDSILNVGSCVLRIHKTWTFSKFVRNIVIPCDYPFYVTLGDENEVMTLCVFELNLRIESLANNKLEFPFSDRQRSILNVTGTNWRAIQFYVCEIYCPSKKIESDSWSQKALHVKLERREYRAQPSSVHCVMRCRKKQYSCQLHSSATSARAYTVMNVCWPFPVKRF